MSILEEAAAASIKMTSHRDADNVVDELKTRWKLVHETAKEWVARMTTLVECWNKLDGNVGELTSLVEEKVRSVSEYGMYILIPFQDLSAPEGKSELSIEKLEMQLNTLKEMFAEKQQLVNDLDAYGPGGPTPAVAAPPMEIEPQEPSVIM